MKQITEAQFLEKAQRYTDRKLSELRFECFWIIVSGILATTGLYISVCHYWKYCTQLDGLYLFGWLLVLGPLLSAPLLISIEHTKRYYNIGKEKIEEKINYFSTKFDII